MVEETEDALLKAKEEMILNYVKSISEFLKLPKTPPVIFCNQYTSMGPNAAACIDIVSWKIEISRIHLQKKGIEEVKKTVAHEITHLIEEDHTPRFFQILNEIIVETWQPEFSSGISIINGGASVELSGEKHEEKDTTRCNYHLCRKEAKLLRCPYCRDYFCIDHIKPMPPSFPEFDYPNKFNEQKFRDEHHPCANYYIVIERKHKERLLKYEQSLNRMNRRYQI